MAMIAVGAIGGLSALVYAGNRELHKHPDYLMAKALGAFGDSDKQREAYYAARQEERQEERKQANLKKIKELRSEIGRRALEWNIRRVQENRMRDHKNKIRSHEIRLREQERMHNHARMMRAIEDARVAAQAQLSEEMRELVERKKTLREKSKMIDRCVKSRKRLYREHRAILRQMSKVHESMDSIL